MRTLVDAVETWPTPKLAGAAVLAVLLPVAGTPFVPFAGDLALGLLSTGALVGAGLGWRHRVGVLNLPLQLADCGARGVQRGTPVYRFRVWLGRGREMRVERAVVRYVSGDASHDLAPELGAGLQVVGPLTLLVRDTAEVCRGGGRFEVDVQAREGDKLWAVSATYAEDELQHGRFCKGLALAGGLRFEADGFGVIGD